MISQVAGRVPVIAGAGSNNTREAIDFSKHAKAAGAEAATDTNLDREVAIKILPEAFSDDRDRLSRFEREAKLLASLNHPNIAAVYGLHHADTASGRWMYRPQFGNTRPTVTTITAKAPWKSAT